MNQATLDHYTTLPARQGKTCSISANWIASSFLLSLGSLLNIFAYSSLEPLVIAILFYSFGAFFLNVPRIGGMYERKMFRMVFSVCWFMAGIAAIYANYLNDPFQNTSDAISFFNLATEGARGLTLGDLKGISQGAGVIVIWRFVYDFFSRIGFEKVRYIGILVNVFSVALSGVIAIKIVKHTFGADTPRFNRLILFFSLSGLFWLFASIHVRDAVVLLGVTSLVYFWVRYLEKPQLINFVLLFFATAIGFALFGALRTQFVFVPLAMLMAGLAACLFHTTTKRSRMVGRYTFILLGVVIAGFLYSTLHDSLFRMVQGAYGGYLEAATLQSSGDSLGYRFITAAPWPLRLVFGSAYLFVFPIPFWSGFQLESVYHLFKSFNVLFFYAVTPLFALALLRICQVKTLRRPSVMFLLFLVIGFTLSIAGTSLETRHFGTFQVSLLVLATLPDLTARRDRMAYKKLLFVFLAMMGFVYLVWFCLKFI